MAVATDMGAAQQTRQGNILKKQTARSNPRFSWVGGQKSFLKSATDDPESEPELRGKFESYTLFLRRLINDLGVHSFRPM